MKNLKRVFIFAMIFFTLGTLTSCGDDSAKSTFDPSLGIIIDQNNSSTESSASISDFTVSVQANNQLGYATYTVEKDVVMLKANPLNGASFLGWYTVDDFSGEAVSYLTNCSLTASDLSDLTNDREITFYARFETVYKITYNLNGGSFVGDAGPSQYVSENRDQPLSENVSKNGYRFAGWRLSTTGQTVNKIPANEKGDITLTAVWDDLSSNDIFKNTVWKIESSTENAYAIITFNADRTLDIFSYNGEESRPYVNSGAALNLRYSYINYVEGKDHISPAQLTNIKYECNTPYYKYEKTATGCEILPLNELPSSKMADAFKLIYGDIRYYMDIKSDGNAEFKIKLISSVSYDGRLYSTTEWMMYIMDNMYGTLPDASKVSYTYDIVPIGLTFSRVANDVTSYEFNAFSSAHKPNANYSLDQECMIKDTNIQLREENGEFVYFRAAFQQGDSLYTSFYIMDLYLIEFSSVQFYEVGNMEKTDLPYQIPVFSYTE